ncbi:MAG: sulfatase-like hydrolase/transferase [Planctomycetaceae bacterium]|nr:sulfatase-like hydrolase/transferase [Planctomycetaceae bacterium]
MSDCCPRLAILRLLRQLVAVVALVVALQAGYTVAAEARARPNIVLIMADDIGIEGLGCYGGLDYKTPELDRLAAGGLRFTHAYAQPLCSPTRLQVMTGRGNQRNWQAFGILPRGEQTIGHRMSELGYRTCLAGKWQLTSYDPPDFPGAKERRGTGMHPRDAGFDTYSLFHAEETEDKGSRYANPTFLRDGKLHREVSGKYGEDLTLEFIIDFLKEPSDRPAFVYYPMALPHWPMVPTPHSIVWGEPERRLEEGTKYFPDMVEYMDFLVGRLVKEIDRLGQRENTLILFYSDNGTDRRITSRFRDGSEARFRNSRGELVPPAGVKIRGGKGQTTQNGIRVPLIASWPGTVKPGVSRELVSSTDFLPTLVEIAGGKVQPQPGIDGVSFAHLLRGGDGTSRESIFFWYDPRPGWDKEPYRRHIFALDGQYKLFSDGGLYDIRGTGFREEPVPADADDAESVAARSHLQAVIEAKMQPPLSAAARREVDAFGRPVQAD